MSHHDGIKPPTALRDLVTHVRSLMATELRMARTELRDALNRAGTGAVYLAIALLFALVAFHALALTSVLALAALGIPLVWAALATSILVLVVAGVFALAGSHCLKKSTLAPKRTIAHLRADLASFEEITRV